MAISFTEIAGAGDVMASNRHTLYFPTLPNGKNGKDLTLRHTEISLPPWEVGQIVVKLFGWSLAFAGRRNSPNAFQCSFVETTGAPVLNALYGWQAMAAGYKQAGGQLKSQYAVEGKLVVADTTGKYALTCKLYNIWPQSITPGAFGENSDAWHHDVAFSVDAVDIVGISTYETAHRTLKNLDFESTIGQESSYAMNALGLNSGYYSTPDTTGVAFRIAAINAAFFGV